MAAPVRARAGRRSTRSLAWLLAVALTLAAQFAVLAIPQYPRPDGGPGLVTAVQANGPRFLVVLAIPLVLALVPLVVRGRARRGVSIACTVLYCAFTALSLLSIGAYLTPAAVAMIVSVSLPARHGPR